MALSIILPTKDRGVVFEKTLEAARLAIQNMPAEIIIINDSKKADLKSFATPDNTIKVINNPSSGVASARNLGVKNAKYDTLLFLDDDILINKSNLLAALDFALQYPDAALNINWTYPPELTEAISITQFGRYLIKHQFTSLKGWRRNTFFDDTNIFELDYIASYFLFLRKDLFLKVGGYNESFPHAGAEDFEFAYRLKKSGIKGYCNSLSIVYHNESDRTLLKPWLERKERSAETRIIAVNMGLSEVEIISSTFKINFALFLYHFKNLAYTSLKIIPNIKFFDFLYFRIVNILLALYIFKGYYKSKRF